MPDPRLLMTQKIPGEPRPKPPLEKLVSGVVSQVKGNDVFVIFDPPYEKTIQHGPMNYGSTKPSVGEHCLVAFDVNQRGYIIWNK
jgi:hypothetical protein